MKILFVNEHYPDNAAGRFSFNVMASVAKYYSENLREEVLKGMDEKAAQGWYPGHAPYGYKNVRLDNGEAIIVIDPERVQKVKWLFETLCRESLTLDGLVAQAYKAGIYYTSNTPKFPRSTLYDLLKNPFYVGRFKLRGHLYSGKHSPIIAESVFQRAQEILGGNKYLKHRLPYAGALMTCCYCGHAITGEIKSKKTRSGIKKYDYYHCSRYTNEGHPTNRSLRVNGTLLEKELTKVAGRFHIGSPAVKKWFREFILRAEQDSEQFRKKHLQSLQVQKTKLENRLDQLYTDKLDGIVLPDRWEELNYKWSLQSQKIEHQINRYSDGYAHHLDTGLQVFELTQTLADKFVTFDSRKKRAIVEVVCLNLEFDGVSLYPTYRKPFDILAKEPVLSYGRGDWIRTSDLLHPMQAR